MTVETSATRSALLVMDIQNGIVERVGNDPALLERLASVAASARNAGIPVIYVVVKFREGYPEISSNNRTFSPLKAGAMPFTDTDPSTEVHPAVAPQPGDVVVTKRRVGAFSGSDLEIVLRAYDVNSLILTGIATSGVVLSTVRAASDMDFRLTVLSDCCVDSDEAVQDVLMNKVFPRQAEVITAEEWQATLTKP